MQINYSPLKQKKMKNVIRIIPAMLMMFLLSNNASAQKSNNQVKPFDVQYVGSNEGYLTFTISVAGSTKQHAALKISEKNEGEIFSEYWGKNITSKTFKIEKKDVNDLSFTLFIGNQNFTKKIVINTITDEKNIVIAEKDVVVL